MWHFQRIICIWICCVSCMFGTTQLSSSLVRAVPYEYFDDHEQSFYDLDSEQIQAKYDTRLLSQQMLQTQQQQQQQHQQQQQQQQQHLENLKGFHTPTSERRSGKGKLNDGAAAALAFIPPATTKLKNNDGHMLGVQPDLNDDAANNNERNDWLEETATKAAAPTTRTTTITETLDELHLPRAASCFTNGQKFTHGQKVPRLDNCEVCLCMDGEIFCWWEKCDKKPPKATIAYDDDYSTPLEELSTTRVHLNPKTTYKTTLKPMKKPKINDDYKYDDDDSAEIREMQREYEGLREQLMRNEYDESAQHKTHHNKKMAKKKIYQQQEGEKHDKKLEEENKNKNKNKKIKEEKQQHNQKQHKTNEQHHRTHNHNNNNNNSNNNRNNNNHDYGLSGSSSKILNFPENLPSVLYYDYKTEEHHQHQHQHREQHLKHQKQKQQQQQQQQRLLLQQHEKELKHQQQQQQKQQQQREIQKNHVNRQQEYGQDFNTHTNTPLATAAAAGNKDTEPGQGQAKDKATRGSKAMGDEEEQLHGRVGESSTTFKYFSNANENIYPDDMQTDSDILPEPPTNKPKYLTSITDTTTTTTSSAKTTGSPLLQFYRFSTAMMATTAGSTTKSANTTGAASTNSPTTASELLQKNIVSPWDYNQPNRDKINNNNSDNNGNDGNTKSNDNKSKSSEDTMEAVDQDDAFHRWLTSTETNNKNNFTLNEAIIARDDNDDDDEDDDGLDVVAAAAGNGVDGSNNDYNLDERNYENINWETDQQLANTLNAKAKADMRPATLNVAATTTTTTAINAIGAGGGEALFRYYEPFQKPKYEQNSNENNSYNNKSNRLANSNEIVNGNNNNSNNNSPFSGTAYENNNRNSSEMVRPTSGSRGVPSSTASNEDNGVASVVNIDIMLTASSSSSADSKNLLQPQQTTMETTNQHRQLQQQLDFESKKQIASTQLKFRQPQVLISKTNDVVNNSPLYSIINDNSRNVNASNGNGNNNNNTNNTQLQNVGVNLSTSSNSNSNNFNNNNASSQSLSSSSDIFKLQHHLVALMPQPNSTSTSAAAAATPPSPTTTLSPERQCNVMGTLYKIGDILPQDTGNCLQCICIDGSTSDDTPRVTCSPHNCPPLVLPDLFDATGY